MKVLTVRSALSDNGPGTQPLVIARRMRALGHETVFAASGGAYVPTIRENEFAVEVIPELATSRHDPTSVMRAVLKLARLIRAERPDVIHGHNAAATFCAYLASGGRLPCVTSVRGVEERSSHQWRNGIWKRLPGVLLGVCMKTRERLLGFGCSPDKIVVTYNGIDAERFRPEQGDREAVRRELGLSGRVVVGTTGAMVGGDHLDGPTKGQHNLVRAVHRLLGEFPDLAILLVGDGPKRAAVERVAESLGMRERVIFAGRRFDVPRMLSAMDIYCLASIDGEFFPNSIIEAMSMGLTWVGSDIAGLSELTADGEAGWVSPIGDIEALAGNLRILAADAELRARRGTRARREVTERFTIAKVADRIIEGYRLAGLHPAALEPSIP